jgi:RNAse (barnase) inhibitor barstar
VTVTLQEAIKSGNGGVFRWDERKSGDLPLIPPSPGVSQVVIDLGPVHDRRAFFKKIAGDLAFPVHFGHNLDAFYDCLTDHGGKVEAGLVLVLADASGFARAEPEEFAAVVDALRDAADYWKENGKALLAVIQLEQPVLAPELPEITKP